MKSRLLTTIATLCLCLSTVSVTATSDWPQWRGPGRDGISRESGLLRQWPAQGPKLLWQVNDIGDGYSTPAVVGTRIYRPDTGVFDTELGPVFCNFLLADEINRAPAKVQSALLEVMQEHQVTIGKQTFTVPDPMLVMATQNPIESEGTYPLPEAQVDRFMLKILVDYPARDEELTVVQRSLVPPPDLRQELSLDDLLMLQQAVAKVYVDPAVIGYTVTLATATREPAKHGVGDIAPYVAFGASPRGPISLVQSARALALIRGRDYVLAQDLQELAKDAFRHRLVLSYQALAEEVGPDAILDQVLSKVPLPQIDLGRATAA